MKNIEVGDFESFLLANKKQIINDFYETNFEEIKQKTGAKSVGSIKSGILVIVSALVAYVAHNCQLPIPELLKEILINTSCITIGGVALVNIVKSIELIVCSVISRKNAKQQFEFIFNMAHTFKADFDNGRIPDFVAVLSDDSGIIANIVLMTGSKNNVAAKTEFINLHLPNGEIVVLEKDDFVGRLIALDEHIMYNPYTGSELDALELQEIIIAYAKIQGKRNELDVEKRNQLNDLLNELEHKVMKKTGFGNNLSNQGPKRILRKEENE